jgi:hypothetical protein
MAQAPARVVLTSGFSGRYTGGVREFEVEAKTLHGVIKTLDELYPGLGKPLEEDPRRRWLFLNTVDSPCGWRITKPGCDGCPRESYFSRNWSVSTSVAVLAQA